MAKTMTKKWPRALTEEECRARAGFFRQQAADLEELRRLDGKIASLRKGHRLSDHKVLQAYVNARRSLAYALDRAQAKALGGGLVSRSETVPHEEPGFSPAGYFESFLRANSIQVTMPDGTPGRLEYR